MEIPPYVKAVMQPLFDNGFDVYAVGGCVRDSMLGKTPHDFDLTSSASPDKMKGIFSCFSTVETGISHGTLTVISDGKPVEITTFRKDGKYTDHRRPDSVSFTQSLENDLLRRDFTVNAMAYNDRVGLVDPFGGADHLEKGVIRCVGEAETRFEEDALRILRGLRFSARLGFSIDGETAAGMHKKAHLLKAISAERIFAELSGILCERGDRVRRLLLDFSDIFATVIPELSPCIGFEQKNPYHQYDVYTHIAYTVGYTPPNRTVRFAALLHDIGKPSAFSVDERGIGHFYGHPGLSAEIALSVLERLHADSKLMGDVKALVLYHDDDIFRQDPSVKRMMIKVGEHNFFNLLDLKKADRLAHSEGHRDIFDIEDVEITAKRILAEGQCLHTNQLEINGRDILALGIREGEAVGKILNALLWEVIDGRLENRRDELLFRAKQLISSGNLPQSPEKP